MIPQATIVNLVVKVIEGLWAWSYGGTLRSFEGIYTSTAMSEVHRLVSILLSSTVTLSLRSSGDFGLSGRSWMVPACRIIGIGVSPGY